MGHRDLLVTQNLSQPTGNQPPVTSRVASAARAALFKRGSRLQPCSQRRAVDSQLALQSPFSCASHSTPAAHSPIAFIFAADALKFSRFLPLLKLLPKPLA